MEERREKKEYELAFLVKGANDNSEVEKILNQFEAEISYRSPLTDVLLSYPIKKYNQAYFGFVQFKTSPEKAEKIMPAMKLAALILRAFLAASPLPVKKAERVSRGVGESGGEIRSKYSEKASPVVSAGNVLTNEALEAKLEEILK